MEKKNRQIKITLLGSPQSIKNAKVITDKTGKKRNYDPQKQVRLSDIVLIRSQMDDNGGRRLFKGPIKIQMTFYMGGAKNIADVSLRGQPYDKKCDIELMKEYYINILNGTVFHIDEQPIEIIADKLYSDIRKTEIRVTELGG